MADRPEDIVWVWAKEFKDKHFRAHCYVDRMTEWKWDSEESLDTYLSAIRTWQAMSKKETT